MQAYLISIPVSGILHRSGNTDAPYIYSITVHKIHLSCVRVRRWESKWRICAMGRATNAREESYPPYTMPSRRWVTLVAIRILGRTCASPESTEVIWTRLDGRWMRRALRSPFIGLHEKFRTHIPRCSVSFAVAASLSSADRL